MTSEASLANSVGRGWNLEHSYAQLPSVFFQDAESATFTAPDVCVVNHSLAEQLGLEFAGQSNQDAALFWTGQQLPPDARTIAQAYAGHQFGGFTMLGDGRAVLFGEQRTPNGQLFDVQFKGSGRTAFSRGGDGLAALGPMLREYIISEALAGFGIPTTRSLAVATTGDAVYRQTPLQGAVLTRVAASHLRVGTFQYAAARQEPENLRILADYAIARHYPELDEHSEKYLQFFRAVMDRQASLISQWQLVGFIHGVMNTDNMTISGEAIDFGPCAFMNTYHSETVFSSIDHGGRYAYGNQPNIGQWNLSRFAETLLPLINEDTDRAIEIATEALHEYPEILQGYWLEGMRKKLGLQSEEADDVKLVTELLTWMETSKADFTETFDDLSTGDLEKEMYNDDVFQSWKRQYRERIQREPSGSASSKELMLSVNPSIIPRNHRVEEALTAAVEHNDLSVMERLLDAIKSTYDRDDRFAEFRSPPPSGLPPYRTFCGT